MSGGFFRGTSADQDTRFSNKQAKLMKSQKFAPELEHLVEMRKVKIDVIRPWIATRVTELLGFEDEVLINFIYGLLDGQVVNGKEVQISLTGFMEKNTGKFMKELWTLLLSAQMNESGVPQQFLDAKAEETRKKQAEADRMMNELQKKREKDKELERERWKKTDGGVETKGQNTAVENASKHMQSKISGGPREDGQEAERNGMRGRSRISGSPRSADHSPSHRGSPSLVSKSFSNSRSYSGDRKKLRSVSRSLEARGRSVSSGRVYRSPRKRSITPRRRHSPLPSISPPRRRSSYSRRRSRSSSRRRSPLPIRRRRSRSPIRHRRSRSPAGRRRSPSPIRRRRSPSPIRRRRSPSPVRLRRSPSPIRRRRSPSLVRRRRSPSPLRRRRSPSPLCRQSPSCLRTSSPSPVHHRSPQLQYRSPSPSNRRHQRSPPTPNRRSSSPMQRMSRVPTRKRSSESNSPSGSRSPVRRSSMGHRRSPMQSPREKVGTRGKLSPVSRRASSSSSSPRREPSNRKDFRSEVTELSPRPRSPIRSVSPPNTGKRSVGEDRRSTSPCTTPARQRTERTTHKASISPPVQSRKQKPRHDNPETSEENEEICNTREGGDHKSRTSQKHSTHSSISHKQKGSAEKIHKLEDPHERLAGRQDVDSRSHSDKMESRENDQELKSGKSSGKGIYPESRHGQKSPSLHHGSTGSLMTERQVLYTGGQKSDDGNHRHLNNAKYIDRQHKSESKPVSADKIDKKNEGGASGSGSEESDKHKSENKEKRKHKRSHREDVVSDDENSDSSDIEDRKEAKRRRKEEKKLRKEEKRRRREERRRRREERRAEKLKSKDRSDSSSDDEHAGRTGAQPSNEEGTRSDQKRLEIELRNKALESLKAKKGISR